MVIMKTKKCNLCQEIKSFDCYSRSMRGKFGLHSYCKICMNLRWKKWAENNKTRFIERRNEYIKEYYKKNRMFLLSQSKKYYEENRLILLQKRRERYKKKLSEKPEILKNEQMDLHPILRQARTHGGLLTED